MTDLTAWPKRECTLDLCQMCGEELPTVVIMDPNKFPDNDEGDFLEVCEGCKEFAEMGISDSYKRMAIDITEKGNLPVEEGLLPEMPMAEELIKYGKLVKGKGRYLYKGSVYTIKKKGKDQTVITKADV